jgi:hypothetical protein
MGSILLPTEGNRIFPCGKKPESGKEYYCLKNNRWYLNSRVQIFTTIPLYGIMKNNPP